MITISNVDVIEVVRKFASDPKAAGLDVSYLVPTKTGFEKYIMDATKEVRMHFDKLGIHNFDEQGQGQGNKVFLPALIFSNGQIEKSTCSLYRPNAKKGDPRVWFKDLKKYANPTDLLALIQSNTGLIVINCSTTDIPKLLASTNALFWAEVKQEKFELHPNANELLLMLTEVAKRGFIETLRPGPTGVGYTIETLLGIKENSSKKPDFKGIELKSKRVGKGRSKKFNMFNMKPNWDRSRLKSNTDILRERGAYSEEAKRHQLYHTINCIKPNSYGLILDIQNGTLFQNHVNNGTVVKDVLWEMDALYNALAQKHNETFWLSAHAEGSGKSEKFHYTHVNYTTGPDRLKMAILLEAGAITVDYSLSQTPTGGTRSHGYPFKIEKKNLELLFTPVGQYSLT